MTKVVGASEERTTKASEELMKASEERTTDLIKAFIKASEVRTSDLIKASEGKVSGENFLACCMGI